MRLEDLRVIHYRKRAKTENSGQSVTAVPSAELVRWYDEQSRSAHAFCVMSCLRWVWVGSDSELMNLSEQVPASDRCEELCGEDAYRFLLRVACGLESEIAGETDIFGQFKEAWKNSAQPTELQTWIQRIFEDAKEIRSLYLRNVGSGSYGSWVRKLIQKHSGRGPILLVGAGQLARSIAPFLEGLSEEDSAASNSNEIWIWNRSASRLTELHAELTSRTKAPVRVLTDREMEDHAWREAATAVVCVPADAERDPERVRLWNEGCSKEGCEHQTDRLLIHLGDFAERLEAWKDAKNFHPLDEVFALQKAQGEVRTVQVGRATRACAERAKLRSLGGSVSLPHGWEDLAAFA